MIWPKAKYSTVPADRYPQPVELRLYSSRSCRYESSCLWRSAEQETHVRDREKRRHNSSAADHMLRKFCAVTVALDIPAPASDLSASLKENTTGNVSQQTLRQSLDRPRKQTRKHTQTTPAHTPAASHQPGCSGETLGNNRLLRPGRAAWRGRVRNGARCNSKEDGR